jgi:hypothetical protein
MIEISVQVEAVGFVQSELKIASWSSLHSTIAHISDFALETSWSSNTL